MPAHRSLYLLVAFTALLIISTLSGLAVWNNAREAQARIAILHERELGSQDALDDLRSSVYLTAILTRDALLDPGPDQVPEYLNQLSSIRNTARGTLQTLAHSTPDGFQSATISRLEEALETYWTTTEVMLRPSPENKPVQTLEMLRQRLHRRAEILKLVEQIEQVTTQNSAQEQARLAVAGREFRASLAWIAGASSLFGMAISTMTWMRLRSLEEQSLAAESELRMLSAELRTAQEQERKALSRELHDQVGQMLTGLRMELTAISRANETLGIGLSSRLDHAKAIVEQTLSIVRNIAMLLRPSMLDDLGLNPALNWLAKEVSRSSGISIQADVDPRADEMPEAHRTCLYRVVQEALTNATKHSGARAVEVRVDMISNWVQATVSDDGKGFESRPGKRKGLGLVGMEERVKELGGHMRVVSAPGRGTSVEVNLPRPMPVEESNDQDSDRGRSRDRSNRIKTAI